MFLILSNISLPGIKFNMLVTYTYRSDDPIEPGDGSPTKSNAAASHANKPPEMKTFAFYTVVELGTIIPKEEAATAKMDVGEF